MKKNHLLITLLSLLLFNFGCKKPPTQPPDDKPTTCTYPAGNRNYSWRVDTVAWWPSTVGGVWAFADNDAYVLGTIEDGKPPYESRWGRHWNGTVWEDNINAKPGYEDNVGNWIDGDISIAPRNDITGDDHFMVAVGFWSIYAGIAEFDNSIKKWKSYKLQAVGELRSVWTDGKGFFIASGDNGMVYTKDGYTAEWVYQKVPTEFSFFRVHGISKDELYLRCDKAVPGNHFQQIWRYSNKVWLKLIDNQDTTNTPIQIPEAGFSIYDVSAFRCLVTDSLKLYIIGDESFVFESKGQSLDFRKTNLSKLGLPLKQNARTGLDINAFSPNDIWIFGTRYNFYHWNGSNFQKIVIPGLPNNDSQFGDQRKMVKTSTGKLFLPTEVSSQVYVVLQGTPN